MLVARQELAEARRVSEAGEQFDGSNGVRVNWRHHPQYQSDPTPVPAGMGAIFLPALSLKPDREPPVIITVAGKRVAAGTMGRRIAVPPGAYRVVFGSGPASQRLLRDVEMAEGETVVVNPDWATLDVSVVTQNFIPFPGAYEVIRMENHEYLGVGHGVNEDLGQETQVWVVSPGLLKMPIQLQQGVGLVCMTGLLRARCNAARGRDHVSRPVQRFGAAVGFSMRPSWQIPAPGSKARRCKA